MTILRAKERVGRTSGARSAAHGESEDRGEDIMTAATPTTAATTRDTRRKTRVGKVVSTKMEKSIVVSIERRVPHPLYKKYYRRTSTLMAHDEQRQAGVGDMVKIMETRPLSKRKRWRLVEIIEKAK